MFTKRRQLQTPINQAGICECGCGSTTPLATDNHPERGYYKGQHLRFIPGHHVKKGAAHHNWRGGRWVHPSGYVWLYAPDHPHTNAKGYVYEHRLVVETRIGRVLDVTERVHHLNRNRGDNRDENLVLFSSQRAHLQDHHADDLNQWYKEHPELIHQLKSAAGRKGADARWRKK